MHLQNVMDPGRVRDPRTHELIGAGFEVHREIGPGFGEALCRDAFAVELHLRGIPFQTEVPFRVFYKSHRLPSLYRADFVCYDSVIVEIKSLSIRTGPVEQAQMLRYLRSSRKHVALLLNFGLPSLEYRRFVMDDRLAATGPAAPSAARAGSMSPISEK